MFFLGLMLASGLKFNTFSFSVTSNFLALPGQTLQYVTLLANFQSHKLPDFNFNLIRCMIKKSHIDPINFHEKPTDPDLQCFSEWGISGLRRIKA